MIFDTIGDVPQCNHGSFLEVLVRTITLVLCLLLIGTLFSPCSAMTLYELYPNDWQLAADICWQHAHVEREAQHAGTGNQYYAKLLDKMMADEAVSGDTFRKLIAEWHREYDDDVVDAHHWCQLQAAATDRSIIENGYWDFRLEDLEMLGVSSFSYLEYGTWNSPTTFDQMRAWAYFYRFYKHAQRMRDPQNGFIPPRHTPQPKNGTVS